MNNNYYMKGKVSLDQGKAQTLKKDIFNLYKKRFRVTLLKNTVTLQVLAKCRSDVS